jgi:hypothetical protein
LANNTENSIREGSSPEHEAARTEPRFETPD